MTSRAAAGIRVLSANVRIPRDQGDAAWSTRRGLLGRVLRETEADLIGTQELTGPQIPDLLAELPGMDLFGMDRLGGRDDEHCAILVRAARFEVLDHGEFWLSDTPETPGSISWDHLHPRLTTWVRLRERGSGASAGRELLHANTHFPYRPEDERARELAASLLVLRLRGLADGIPLVLTGDFNTDPASGVHGILAAELEDVRDTAPHSGPDGTFHGFTGEPGRRIDWILQRGLRSLASRTLDDHEGAVWPSDHFPVLADLAWPEPPL